MSEGRTNGVAARLGVVTEPRYLAQAQPAGVLQALTFRPVDVVAVDDADGLEGCDLVVARGRSPHVLDLLDQAERRGIRAVNRAAAIRSVLDKTAMQRALDANGVRTPWSWHGRFEDVAADVRMLAFPVVVKPVRGDNCRDVAVLASGREIDSLHWAEPDVIVQRWIANDGSDLKLYGVGDIVWAVRKPSPLGGPGASRMIPLRPEHVTVAHACRDTFGLDLYGVDCIETEEGLVVIEVNDYPNYTGIAAADDRLADHLMTVLRDGLVAA